MNIFQCNFDSKFSLIFLISLFFGKKIINTNPCIGKLGFIISQHNAVFMLLESYKWIHFLLHKIK